MTETLVWFVGLLFVLAQFYKFAFWIYLNFFRQNDMSKYKAGKKEPWALVTGATDGIGKAFAEELAARKFNIVLLSRTQSKLEDVKKEIEQKFNVKVQVLAVDAANATEEIYQSIREKVAPLELSVLVNNVGVSHLPDYLEKVSVEELESIIKINILFSLRITQVLLPQLKKHRNSAIINLSSISSAAPTPFLTTYAASKAFNRNFSVSLALECVESGVDVQSIDPGFVISNMSRMKKASLTVCTARRCANDALRKLPYQDVTPYWAHGAMQWGMRSLPKPLYDAYILNMFASLRRKAEQRGIYKKDQ